MVSARGGASAAVDAPNWLAALGVGLDQLGSVGAIDRLACEVLMNGTVLARDARTGQGYVVRPLDVDGANELKEDETSELAFGGEDELPEYDDDSEFLSEAVLEEDPSTEVGELPTSAFSPLVEPVPTSDGRHDPVGALDDSELPIDDAITDRFDRFAGPLMVLEGLADIENAPGLGPACHAALSYLRRAMSAEAGSVMLREPDGSLRFAVVSGPNSARLEGSVLPAGAGIAGFSLQRATGVIVHRAANDPRFYGEVDRQTGFTTESVLCVPIAAAGEAFGCIQLLNPPADRRFVSGDLRLAQDVAEALAQRMLRERLG